MYPPFSWVHAQRALLRLSVFRVVLSAHEWYGILPAHPHPTARAAEVAAVPPDQRVVAALGAFHALHLRRGAGGGRAQHAHGLHRVAFLVENAEHGVAVDDEPRDVRHGRRPVLLFARTGCERHKVAERFGVVQQLAQFHPDPRRVHHAHIERQDLAQAIQRARVFAREPHRVRASHSHGGAVVRRSEEHTSELQSLAYLVCRLLLEKKKKHKNKIYLHIKTPKTKHI